MHTYAHGESARGRNGEIKKGVKGAWMWERKRRSAGCAKRARWVGGLGGGEYSIGRWVVGIVWEGWKGGGETGCSAWMRAKMYFFSSFFISSLRANRGRLDYQSRAVPPARSSLSST